MQLLNGIIVFELSILFLVTSSFGKFSKFEARQAPDNIVSIDSTSSYCLVVPLDPHTDIGVSEHPGGTKTYCSGAGHTSSEQGQLPPNFWTQVELKTGKGVNGGGYTQLTGCINPSLLDRLNPGDAGGQYDSNGGIGGRGNPAGSKCLGYKSYVELIEPRGRRACLRCCNDVADCPVTKDTQGCPNVIPGNYFDCGL